MVVSGVLVLAILVLFIYCRRKKVGVGDTLGKWMKKRFFMRDDMDKIRSALLVAEEESAKKDAKAWETALAVLFAGGLICLFVSLLSEGPETVQSLLRPAFGEERAINIRVRDDETGYGDIPVSVSGKEPKAEEWEALFDETFEALKPMLLGKNEAFSQIRTDLELPEESANGISISYESSDINVLSDFGLILAEELPDDGAEVVLAVRLSYRENQKEYEIPLCILPAGEKEKSFQERLREQLQEEDVRTLTRDDLILPKEFEGKALVYEIPGLTPEWILVFSLVLSVCLVLLPKEKDRETYQKRNAELEAAYPSVLTKLQTLIHAGMSTRNAWRRITENYEKEVSGKGKKREYVYEEMRITANELQTGISETEAYVRFGRRCGTHCYLKFGNLLAQNVRQGVSGLEEALRYEAENALEERRTRAVRAGEKAGTKQLFPMLLMLGIVIVTLVAPTLMSF